MQIIHKSGYTLEELKAKYKEITKPDSYIASISSQIVKVLKVDVTTGTEKKSFLLDTNSVVELLFKNENNTLTYAIGKVQFIDSHYQFTLDCSNSFESDIISVSVGSIIYMKLLEKQDLNNKGGIHISTPKLTKVLNPECEACKEFWEEFWKDI